MKKKILVGALIALFFMPTINVDAYQVEQDPINFGGYFPGYATNELIVLHESGNGNNAGPNSLDNEVAYMKR
ncbi:N-acetylmuramoyl-L-alanine amidase, partial [Enterococcus faecalis]